ncbi:hypothetical protein [Streptomyces fructofermentans]|uniref:hypothetical protein n=1 Tax=Streptomyces fructofermentans TaxID=152141 RepID=UPI0016739E8A
MGIASLNWSDADMIRNADQHAVLREGQPRTAPGQLPGGRLAQAACCPVTTATRPSRGR